MSRVDATVGDEGRVLWRLAVPAVAQALLHTAYGFVDYSVVARLGDAAATAALSAAFGVMVVAFGVSEIVTVGTHTLTAQLTGARTPRRRLRMLRRACLMALVAGALVSLMGWGWSDAIAGTLHLEGRAHELAASYLYVLLLGFPARSLLHTVTGAWRGMGNTTAPVILEASTVALNVLLSGALVLGWFGAPALGVAGAALATVLAAVPTASVAAALMLREAAADVRDDVGAPLERAHPAGANVRAILALGLPASLIPVAYGLVFMALYRMAGSAGVPVQAALGAAIRGVEWFGFAISIGYYVAASVAVGQCVGAGLAARARSLALRATVHAAVATQVVGVAMAVFAPACMAIVADDPEVAALGVVYLRWMGPLIFLIGAEIALEGVLIGMGRTAVPMWITGLMNAARIPLAAALIYGSSAVVPGSLFAVGAGPEPALHVADMAAAMGALTATIILSALGKVVWAGLVVWRSDFAAHVARQRGRLGLED